MQTTYKVKDPDKIEFTLTITMSLKDWKELQSQLATNWPSSMLSRDISDVTAKAQKVFYAEED